MKKSFLILLLACIFFNIKAQLPNTISPAQKVFGLSKFWQEVNYNFVYFERVNQKEWDSTYTSLLSTVQKTANDYEYYKELQKFAALLKDGHTSVYLPDQIKEMVTMFGKYRLFLKNIDGKAIVEYNNAFTQAVIPVGTEILSVNGLSVQDYLKRNIYPYISSSTGYVLEDTGIRTLFQGLKGDKYHVKFKTPAGKIQEVDLVHEQAIEPDINPAIPAGGLLNFKWEADKIAYMALNSFSDAKINDLFQEKLSELYQAKALIIDLRNNGGGDSRIGRNILQYFANDTLLYGSKSRSRLNIGTYRARGAFTNPKDTVGNETARRYLLTYQAKAYESFDYAPYVVAIKNRIVVPIVLLMGHNTASAAEDFLIYADKQKQMYKIGENSNGSTGQPLIFTLPGGGEAWICTKQDTYADGREFVGFGVQPDLIVKPTLTDYMNKKDPALEAALKYLKKKI